MLTLEGLTTNKLTVWLGAHFGDWREIVQKSKTDVLNKGKTGINYFC
jgi:hypothetical protein